MASAEHCALRGGFRYRPTASRTPSPSKLGKAPGERVKTDRRDALRLTKLLRLDELTAVRLPSAFEEGARDLVRSREDARSDLMRARHRLGKLLLRQGLVWDLVAMVSTGRAGLARILMGEVVERVIREVPSSTIPLQAEHAVRSRVEQEIAALKARLAKGRELLEAGFAPGASRELSTVRGQEHAAHTLAGGVWPPPIVASDTRRTPNAAGRWRKASTSRSSTRASKPRCAPNIGSGVEDASVRRRG